jgi:hypothetical protein
MIDKKTWKEFRESGLLWWINMILHTFGWSIVIDIEKDGTITNCYPARVKFRGFNNENNTAGYIKVSEYLEKNIQEIKEEAEN